MCEAIKPLVKMIQTRGLTQSVYGIGYTHYHHLHPTCFRDPLTNGVRPYVVPSPGLETSKKTNAWMPQQIKQAGIRPDVYIGKDYV